MNFTDIFLKLVEKLVAALPFLKHSESIPWLSKRIEAQHDKTLDEMQAAIMPYRERFPAFSILPAAKVSKDQISAWVQQMAEEEKPTWEEGYASGSVYHGDKEHIDFLNQIYALTSQSNPLHADIWPSSAKYASEIIAMTAAMLGGEFVSSSKVGGTLSSGGSESIMLAMKTYRDWARKEKGIKHPEAVIPISAHPAFDKACHYFGIKKITIPVDGSYQAAVSAIPKALSRRTIVMVGSAPSFPHGIIDPIAEMAAIAKERNIGFHTDSCLGGFMLPWIDSSYRVPAFDFRLPGVTSISVDTHKFGFASKGSSVLLFRDGKMRHHQYFTSTDWPGGLYFSPTFAGSRPGALIAQCWAAMLAMGQEGYRHAAATIMATADTIKRELLTIPGMEILGNPLWVIAFTNRERNIFDIMDKMNTMGWRLNGLHRPNCVHICLTLRHTQAGVAERFITDLRAAVVAADPLGRAGSGIAPVYGMAAQIPLRGVVSKFLKKYMDRLHDG
jgi:glutamate/tyrosine decarboxylase-like PLP-dependent enzyme